MDYNVIVIGAGSGGLVSAYICATLKAKVLLIEKNKMGGDCLNTGCVPSKALIRTASVVSQINRHREFGIQSASVNFDFSEVMERVQRIIQKVEPHDSVERYSQLGVECLEGEAEIISPHEVKVSGRVYTTKNIIVATGAVPHVPQIPGLDVAEYFTTDTIWSLREQPKRLAIVGGGPIGAELSQCFARLGIQVTQVHSGNHILNREDSDIADLLHKRLVKEGVDLRLNAKATEVLIEGDKKFIVVDRDGKKTRIEYDALLLALGRQPNTRGFGLEKLGVKIDGAGRIITDQYSRTSVKNIFACGDCTSPYQFTHMASHQAWYCAVNALFQPWVKFKIDWRLVPWTTYTDPEIARCGLNEQEAKDRNIAYDKAVFPIDDLDRAIADSEDYGMIKVLTPKNKDKILGVTICAHHASNLLPEFVQAMKQGLGLSQILGTIHCYPSMAEANKYVAGVWKKDHAPQRVLALLKKIHTWRRKK